ncbi:MAG: 2-C-methyl-D-erythritol 4-phosphate cytidylyltransferase [Planctomycetota bacterium]
MRIAVIIPAAGSSTRFNDAGLGTRSKLDEDLGGRPVLHRTVELFANYANPDPLELTDVGPIIVAGPHDDDAFAEFKLRHGDKLAILGVILCKGGQTHRYETVAAALKHVPADATHIAVHDAARPCASTELLDRVFRAARTHAAVVPAVPVSDTIKRIEPEPLPDDAADPLAAILTDDAATKKAESFAVRETVKRDDLRAVQTPQVFERELLQRAYSQDDLNSTDDAQLIERLGERVVLVPGEPTNIKITVPTDLQLARTILGVKPPKERPSHLKF